MRRGAVVLLVLLAGVPAIAQMPAASGVRECVGLGPGGWFPADKAALIAMVDNFLAKVPEQKLPGKPLAVISPHAGFRYSGQVAAYSFKVLAAAKPERVIILAPSHYVAMRSVSIAPVSAYRTPLGDVPLDRVACDKLLDNPLVVSNPAAHAREHSLQNLLPFLQRTLGEFKIVPLVVGQLRDEDYEKLAASLRPLLDEHTAIAVSSDFTHYGQGFGFTPFKDDLKGNIERLDTGAADRIRALDFAGFVQYTDRTGATICGRHPIALMLKMLEGRKDVEGKLVKYASSGEATGQYDGAVSYVSLVLYRKEGEAVAPQAEAKYLTDAEEKTLLRLARRTLQTYLTTRKTPDPAAEGIELTEKLKAKGAAFVTLTQRGQLRGCIGHVIAQEPLYQSVMENAVNASTRDPRFPPMTAQEEKTVHIEISVMTPLELIDDPSKVVVGKHGILIRKGFNQGLLLPQVATEYGWNREAFLDQTCIKAGLPRNAWKEGAQIFVFSAQVFGEAE